MEGVAGWDRDYIAAQLMNTVEQIGRQIVACLLLALAGPWTPSHSYSVNCVSSLDWLPASDLHLSWEPGRWLMGNHTLWVWFLLLHASLAYSQSPAAWELPLLEGELRLLVGMAGKAADWRVLCIFVWLLTPMNPGWYSPNYFWSSRVSQLRVDCTLLTLHM